MNADEHLLTCLSEECAEVIHRVSKCLRFSMDDIQSGQSLTNRQRLVYEFEDLIAVHGILVRNHTLYIPPLQEGEPQKVAKIRKYMTYAKWLGTLQ